MSELDYTEELPDGWTPLEAISVVKCLNEEGGVALVARGTDGISAWEALGMLMYAADLQRDEMRGAFFEGD